MESFRIFLVSSFSGNMVKNFYLLSGVLISCFYIPQVLRILKDTTGAAAISLFAWTGWTILRFPAVFYAIVIPKDWIMFYVVLLDVAGRIVILSIASYKRSQFNKAVGENSGFSVIDVDSENMIKMKRDVIKRNTIISSGYPNSMRAMMELREKEEKSDNFSLDAYIQTEKMENLNNVKPVLKKVSQQSSQQSLQGLTQGVKIKKPWYKKS